MSWHAELGATGIPKDQTLKERLKDNPLPDFASLPLSAPSPLSRPDTTADRNERPAHNPAPRPLPDQPTELIRGKDPKPNTGRGGPKKNLPLAPRSDPEILKALGASLEEVALRVSGCTACGLSEGRTQTVFSRGTGASGICFVGEGPGKDEDEQGLPFVGAAGQLLDKMISAMGLVRDEVYVCNIVKCRPPDNRAPTPDEMHTCSPYLERQLELLSPQVIVALGGTAVSGLLGISDGITRIRGSFRLYKGKIPVMPTFHPAYLLRNPRAKKEVWADLQQVLSHLGRAAPR